MKTCSKCQRVLPLDQFHARGSDKRASRCRDCTKQDWIDRPKRLAYIEPKEKPCSRCSRTLPAADFPRNRYNKSGLNSMCKACCSAQHKTRMDTLVVIPVTEKRCKGCDRTQDASSFTKKASNNDGLSSRCKDCMRLVKVERLYKIPPERYLEMVKGGCQICGSFDRLTVDHNHSCCPGESSCGKCVRGILCDDHNTGLGRFKDNPEHLDAGAAYLRNSLL